MIVLTLFYKLVFIDINHMTQSDDLRNEFHFSDVHGAMNHSGSRAK